VQLPAPLDSREVQPVAPGCRPPATAGRLREHGYPVTIAEVPDVHTFTAWRDAFDPHLTELLHRT
jgi:hypothetical protein